MNYWQTVMLSCLLVYAVFKALLNIKQLTINFC